MISSLNGINIRGFQTSTQYVLYKVRSDFVIQSVSKIHSTQRGSVLYALAGKNVCVTVSFFFLTVCIILVLRQVCNDKYRKLRHYAGLHRAEFLITDGLIRNFWLKNSRHVTN